MANEPGVEISDYVRVTDPVAVPWLQSLMQQTGLTSVGDFLSRYIVERAQSDSAAAAGSVAVLATDAATTDAVQPQTP